MKMFHDQRRKRHTGFTLIEIIVVITIIVIIMSLTVGAMRWVGTKRMEEQSKVITQRVGLALDQFYTDNGYYPDGDGSENSTIELYKALFGDYNGDGVPDKNKKGKRNTIYMEDLDPNQQRTEPLVKDSGSGYILLDPWGAPYRYRLGFQQKDSKNKDGTGKNPDYDFWTTGKDGQTNLKSNDKTGVNEDDIGKI